MDISKKYIEMCEKAEEIQKLTNGFQVGDFIWLGKKYIYQAFVCDKTIFIKGEEIWLPRQDQLQEILSYTIQAELLNAFYTFAFRDSWCGKLDSMEQLWLAFVMKEKYQKIWSEHDKDWITPKKPFTLDKEYFKGEI